MGEIFEAQLGLIAFAYILEGLFIADIDPRLAEASD